MNENLEINNNEIENKEIKEVESENGSTILSYLGDKASLGFEKGLTTIKDVAVNVSGLGALYDIFPNLKKEANEDILKRKEQIIELEKQVDDFYEQNKDDITGVGWFAGQVAEGLCNPFEMGSNMLVGSLTGGTSLGVKILANIGADALVQTAQTGTIYDRLPTTSEYAIGAVSSIIPDVAGHYIGRKFKFNSRENVDLGDSTLNVRKIKETIDDEGLYEGATKLQYQTQNKVTYDSDVADVKKINNVADITKGIPTFLQRRNEIDNGKYIKNISNFDVANDTISRNLDEINLFSKHIAGESSEKITLGGTRKHIKTQIRNFEKQQILVADEYSGLLKMTPNEFLNEIGFDNDSIVRNFKSGGVTGNNLKYYDFLQSAVRDRQILNKETKFMYLSDIPNSSDFVSRNSNWIDNSGKLKVTRSQNFHMFENLLKQKDFDTIMYLNDIDPIEARNFLENKIEKRADKWYDKKDLFQFKIYDKGINHEFTLDKDKLISEVENLFETNIKGVYENNLSNVKLKEGMESTFDELFGDIPNSVNSKQEYIDNVFNYVNKLNRTLDVNRGTDSYIPYGLVYREFKGKLSNSKIDFFNKEQFHKNNATILRDIFEKQTREISMLDTFGTRNIYELRSSIENSFNSKNVSKILKKDILSESDIKAINQVKSEWDLALENTFFPKSKSELDTGMKISQTLRSALSRGVMSFAGAGEFTTNPVLAGIRAGKYGENTFSGLGYSMTRMFKRWSENTPNDLPSSKYVLATLEKRNKLNENFFETGKFKRGLNAFDKWGNAINNLSDTNLSYYGESYATKILHQLPESFDKLNGEVKAVLRVQGINADSYSSFRNFAKKHIDDNGLWIDSKALLNMRDENAKALRGAFNVISDDIGNIRSNSIFRTQATDEISKWLGMYRTFARYASSDVFNDMINYTNKEGIRKSRLSMSGLKHTISGKNLKTVSSILALGYVGGKGQLIINDIVYGDRDFSERLGLAETHLESISNKISNEEYLELLTDVVTTTTNSFGFSPELLKAQAPILSTVAKGKKLIEKIKDPLLYTDEKVNESLLFIGREIGSKRVIDFGKAFLDSTIKDWDKVKKPYGLSKEEKIEYIMNTNEWRSKIDSLFTSEDFEKEMNKPVTNKEVKEVMNNLKQQATISSSRSDYIENKNDSFDKLPDKAKDYFDTVINASGMNEYDAENKKAGFAFAYNEANTKSNKNEKLTALNDYLRESFGITTEDVSNYANNFNNLSEKKKDYFERLMRYSKKKVNQREKNKFFKVLGNANSKDIEELLKTYYNVDMKDFYKKEYNTK